MQSAGSKSKPHSTGNSRIVHLLDPNAEVTHSVAAGRRVYVHTALGHAEVNGVPVEKGGGVGTADETEIRIRATEASEVVLFDLG